MYVYIYTSISYKYGSFLNVPDRTLPQTTPPTVGPTVPALVNGTYRTVIFVYKQTNAGQDLFIRGGIDSSQRPGKKTNMNCIQILLTFFVQ